jgi:hypothetical protein
MKSLLLFCVNVLLDTNNNTFMTMNFDNYNQIKESFTQFHNIEMSRITALIYLYDYKIVGKYVREELLNNKCDTIDIYGKYEYDNFIEKLQDLYNVDVILNNSYPNDYITIILNYTFLMPMSIGDYIITINIHNVKSFKKIAFVDIDELEYINIKKEIGYISGNTNKLLNVMNDMVLLILRIYSII